MKIASGLKKVVKPFIDIPTWIGYQQLADMSRAVASLFKNLFFIKRVETQENFADAVVRLKLSEKDIQQRTKEFKYLTILFAFLSCGVFVYTLYLIGDGAWRGVFAGFSITAVLLAYTFRYHFWLFQIKQRRLGCTFRDWWRANFIGNKK